MELWMVTFGDDADLAECNGVYSTREKAIAAVDQHFRLMEDDGGYRYSWDNRKIDYQDEDWRCDTFDLVNHGHVYGTMKEVEKCYVVIEKKYLDDEIE